MTEQNQAGYQSQHHFLSDSPWSAQALMQRISLDTNALLGDRQKQSYSVDESSNGKSGKHSVGVILPIQRQLGKDRKQPDGRICFLEQLQLGGHYQHPPFFAR